MADLVDVHDVDVFAFGLATDFRTELFPASRRLFELADEVARLQVEVLCWCGREGHAQRPRGRRRRGPRGRAGRHRRHGRAANGHADEVRYQVLCRRHHRSGDLGPRHIAGTRRRHAICPGSIGDIGTPGWRGGRVGLTRAMPRYVQPMPDLPDVYAETGAAVLAGPAARRRRARRRPKGR